MHGFPCASLHVWPHKGPVATAPHPLPGRHPTLGSSTAKSSFVAVTSMLAKKEEVRPVPGDPALVEPRRGGGRLIDGIGIARAGRDARVVDGPPPGKTKSIYVWSFVRFLHPITHARESRREDRVCGDDREPPMVATDGRYAPCPPTEPFQHRLRPTERSVARLSCYPENSVGRSRGISDLDWSVGRQRRAGRTPGRPLDGRLRGGRSVAETPRLNA